MARDAAGVVIGAGPAGLMAAEVMAAAGLPVVVYDRMPSVGRKFLMAGRGGLNLTHAEPTDAFLARYGEAAEWMAPKLSAFPPDALVAWAEGLGQPTFTGSSGRVFPRVMKASPLLRAWLARLAQLGVELSLRWTWRGWDEDGALVFDHPGGRAAVKPRVVLLALGGASWPKLGSDGAWVATLADRGVAVAPLRPANCGFRVAWSAPFAERFQGAPLKTVALSFGAARVRGEATVTRAGLEGGAVYALAAALRDAIARHGRATLDLDLKPDMASAEAAVRLASTPPGQTTSNRLRKALNLSPLAINLLREAHGARLPVEAEALAACVKRARLTLTAPLGLDRAISTAGGVALGEVDADMRLFRLDGRGRAPVFLAGEMLDWEAPTGGYLLQAAFATGRAAGLAAGRALAAAGR